ncbi:hypothetical protein GCM10008960_40470 [Deinococcus sedimenti]|uniref:Uncharacterized protein n=1 Tax=Deinococcus sedimenti TaxID=1867090 RepID=A0ABQ2S9A0_9DEIO|nr:hypothetical protein GCM10008960_40470 [Deinococcus sedimenti]
MNTIRLSVNRVVRQSERFPSSLISGICSQLADSPVPLGMPGVQIEWATDYSQATPSLSRSSFGA